MKLHSVFRYIPLVLAQVATPATAEVPGSQTLLYEMSMSDSTPGWQLQLSEENNPFLVSNLLCHELENCSPHVLFSGYINKNDLYSILVEVEFESFGGEFANVSVSMFENDGLTSTDSVTVDNYLTFTPMVPVTEGSAIHYARFLTQKRYSGFGLAIKHSRTSLKDSDSLILKSLKVYGANLTPSENNTNSDDNSDIDIESQNYEALAALTLSASLTGTFVVGWLCIGMCFVYVSIKGLICPEKKETRPLLRASQ